MSEQAQSMAPVPGAGAPGPLLASALAHHQAGRLGDAEALYLQVLERDPANADALHLLGLVAFSRGAAEEAAGLIGKALKRDPKSVLFLGNLAKAQAAANAPAKAIATLKRLLKIDAENADALNGLGILYAGRGETRKAEHALSRALEAEPGRGEFANNLGLVLAAAKKTGEAIAVLERGRETAPDYPVIHNTLGTVYRDAGKIEDSIASLEQAASLVPGDYRAVSNLAMSLNDAGRYRAAVEKFECALALNPADGQTWRGFAKSLIALGESERALEACRRAIEAAPGDPIPIWERALVNLAAGNFTQGWSDYRARTMADRRRWPAPEAPLTAAAQPSDLDGRHFILTGEQGLGEELFFLRFARRLKDRGARLSAHCDGRLVAMVARAGLIDDVLAKPTGPAKALAQEPGGEAILMGDLPWFAGRGDDAPPPFAIPALDGKRAAIARRLEAAGDGPYAALTWRAGIKGPATLYKEAPAERLILAARALPGTLVALQRNPAEGEIEALSREAGREIADFTDLNDDLEGMIGLIDLYAGVSNTNMHLAAAAIAAGAKLSCHVLVPAPAEFRWLAKGAISPWFPGFSLYRQEPEAEPGRGWDAALEALKASLAAATGAGTTVPGMRNESLQFV